MKLDEPVEEIPVAEEKHAHHISKNFWLGLGVFAIVVLPIGLSYFNLFQEYQDLEKERGHGAAHRFVVDKYLSCRSEFFRPAADECIARLMMVARAKGTDFEDRAGDALRDMKLVD